MTAAPRPALRAVFFDAGNTLLRMNYAAIAVALAARGVTAGPAAVERAEWRARVALDAGVFAPAAAPRPRDSLPSTEHRSVSARYVGHLLQALGVHDPALQADLEAWWRAYNPPVGVWSTADPEAEAALDLVAGAGLRAAVISNSNGSVASILDGLGLGRRLEFVLDSHLVGVEKPDPRIFALALARAGLAPAEAVYVGDLYSIDVRGARAAGVAAVLLDPGGHWGARDCATAPGLLGAVRAILDSRMLGP